MGKWSFGDMAGHLVGWRNRTLARLEALSRGEPQPANPWPAEVDDGDPSDDRINDWIHAQHAGRSPAELVSDYDATFDRLVAIVESIPDATLTDPNLAEWLEGPLVDVDFTDHLHDEHVRSARAWLDAGGTKPA